MTSVRPSLADATLAAYRDAANALRAMPGLAVVTFLAITAMALFDALLMRKIVPAHSLLGREITSLGMYFLLTPFLIAVHRHVILGEATRRYVLEPRGLRFQLFFCWTVVLLVIAKAPTVIFLTFGNANVFAALLVLVLSFVAMLAFVRLTILFPAIAVDAPGATWENAYCDSKGHGWYIFLVLTVPIMLLWIVVAVVAVIEWKMLGPFLWLILIVPIVNAWLVISLAVAVAIASRLYETLGNRVGLPLLSGRS